MKKLALPVLLIVIGVVSLLYYFVQPGGGNDNLDVKIKNTPVIMPAAYKVYANKNALNGKYYLFKMLLTNTGKKTMHDVTIEYKIPGYIDWTQLNKVADLFPGQSTTVTCYPKFKDDIGDKMTKSEEKTDIRITYNGNKNDEVDESFGFTMEGRNDMVYTSIPSSDISSYGDLFDNADLLPCFVMPNDPIVKYFTQQIQQKVLKGEEASVENNPKECVRFMMGIYDATLMANMVYSGTSGVPESFGDVNSFVQSIRLPREVITGKTGLCIELALMYASIMEDAGLHAIVFLAPGHAFPGFELDGRYYAIESTAIGGKGLGGSNTAKQALELGQKELKEELNGIWAGDPRYQIIDINKLNAEGVVPMEMKDDDYLRKKVDEIAKNFERRSPRRVSPTLENNKTPENETTNNMARYVGSASFYYPTYWTRANSPNPQFPFLITILSSQDQQASVDVYHFQGVSSPVEALNYLQSVFYQHGMQVRYAYYGTKGNYQLYQGQTISQLGTYQWIGVMKNTPSGLTAVIAGAFTQAYSQYQPILKTIINSVR